VTKLESVRRPDPLRHTTPELFHRLNGGKSHRSIDFSSPADLARLRVEMLQADVVITSSRSRAFQQLGLEPAAIFADNPSLVWVAITGYGWDGEQADRVAFGDDAAAAGGLVARSRAGAPRFLGDALADPLTGVAAGAGALAALLQGGGVLVDAALSRCAAAAAALLEPVRSS
jgi:crotonobetainyl-CoA:carnitine CoA-transferase CaiB-like acyl-CoA transferase